MAKFTVTMAIPDITLADLLISAVEGGSNYWAKFREYDHGYGINGSTCEISRVHVEVCDVEGGSKGFVDVTVETMARGLQTLANLSSKGEMPGRHIANVINENWDAETADVVLQMALFGKVIYG